MLLKEYYELKYFFYFDFNISASFPFTFAIRKVQNDSQCLKWQVMDYLNQKFHDYEF